MSRALVTLAEQGVAEDAAKAKVAGAYEQFMATEDPKTASGAGGWVVLRLCTINPGTTVADIEHTIARLEQAARGCNDHQP